MAWFLGWLQMAGNASRSTGQSFAGHPELLSYCCCCIFRICDWMPSMVLPIWALRPSWRMGNSWKVTRCCLGNADDGREHPGLVFRILAVHIAGLPLERVHAQVGDHRPAEADQRVIPVAAFLDGEA